MSSKLVLSRPKSQNDFLLHVKGIIDSGVLVSEERCTWDSHVQLVTAQEQEPYPPANYGCHSSTGSRLLASTYGEGCTQRP
jgi:hypothetical protein